MTLPQRVQRAWYQPRGLLSWALWPLSLVYGALIALRRSLYRCGVFRPQHPGVPVVVVGNVVAGGAGKTPVVIALVQYLRAQGWHPGVVSRGYGRSTHDCRLVFPHSLPQDVGDEPLLIARACGVPVAVAPKRIDAARTLITQYPDTNILVCDDGLQHWALARDIEICVFNRHGVGNGLLLPAGPLREPWPHFVDLVVYPETGSAPGGHAPYFELKRQLAHYAVSLDGSHIPLADLHGMPLCAVAAIAQPEDFFTMLRGCGLQLAQAHALPDHYDFCYDFYSYSGKPDKGYRVICTEKDAAKLWQHHPDALAVPLHIQLEGGFFAALDALLQKL